MNVTELTKKQAQVVDKDGHTVAFGPLKARNGHITVHQTKFTVGRIKSVEAVKTWNRITI